MLQYTGKNYQYGGRSYDTFWKGLSAMLSDATWNKKTPKFGNIDINKLNKSEKEQYLLLRAMFEWDIVAVLESDDYKAYTKATKTQIEGGKDLLKMNPLWAKRHSMPATYPGNHSMQTALLPMMDKVYGASTRSVYCANGKYPFKKVISYIADKILFNPLTSAFDAMTIFENLDSNKFTKSLCDYVRNEDMPKARILAMQVEEDDLLVEDFISIGSLRKARYECKTKELWGDSSYMDTMLSLPPAMHSNDYFTWLGNAGRAMGKDLGLDKSRESKEYEMGNYGLDLSAQEAATPEVTAEQENQVNRESTKLVDNSAKEVYRPAEDTQEKYNTARKNVEKIIDEAVPKPVSFHEALKNVLGFEPEDTSNLTVPEELKAAIIAGTANPQEVRMWYVRATAPKKTVREKLAEICGDITDADVEKLPSHLREQLESEDKVSAVTEEAISDWWSAQSVPEDFGPLQQAATQYCSEHGQEFLECYRALESEGYHGEALYRAMPGYIKSKGTVVVESTVTYLFALSDVYGSTRTEYRGGVN